VKPVTIVDWKEDDRHGARWNRDMPAGYIEQTLTKGKILFRYACEGESWMNNSPLISRDEHVREVEGLSNELHAIAHRLGSIWPAESGLHAETTKERIELARANRLPMRAVAQTGDNVAAAIAKAAQEIGILRRGYSSLGQAIRTGRALGEVFQLAERSAASTPTALFYQIATVCYWRLVESRASDDYKEPGPLEVFDSAKAIIAKPIEGINGFKRDGWGAGETPITPSFSSFRQTWQRGRRHRLK
jgi:hypothetical protein